MKRYQIDSKHPH